jgi:type I restriction-modification system DNA methylase subunit
MAMKPNPEITEFRDNKSPVERYRATKEIEKLMEQYSRRNGWYTAFTHFLDFMIFMASHGHIKPQWFDKGTDKDGVLMAKMYKAFGNQDAFEDVLGDLYEEIAGRGHKSAMGQFFTPMHLCDMMALMVAPKEAVEETIRCSEPCSGSGRNVLAFERQCRRIGQRTHWTCVDLDITCVKMTVINMVYNGIRGDVIHGNCLTGQRFGAYSIQVIGGVPIVVKYPTDLMNGLANKVIGWDMTDPKVKEHFRKIREQEEAAKQHEKYGTQSGLFAVSPEQEEAIKYQEKKIKKREKALKSEDRGGDQLSLF